MSDDTKKTQTSAPDNQPQYKKRQTFAIQAKLLWHKKAWILFLVILVVLLPQAVSRPAQMSSKTLLTEITIEKQDNEYTLSGKMVVTKPGGQNGEHETEDITATAPSIAAAINKISAEQGRQVSFAHCTLMIMGESLNSENLADLLQFFLYKTELNNNSALAWAEQGRTTTLEKFYKDYMRTSSTSILTQGATKKAIFKSGEYAFTLDEVQTLAHDFITTKSIDERIVQGENVLGVLSNNCNIKATFINDTPTVDISVKSKMTLESDPHASDEVIAQIKNAVEQDIKTDISDLLDHTYNQNTDILQLYDKFYRGHTKKLKEFLKSNSMNDFFSAIHFNIKVDVEVIT